MKKKRSFLAIISSIFGVFAICGLSVFSMLDHKKEQQKVNAVSVNTLFSQTFSGNVNITSDSNYTYKLYYYYNLSYNRYFDTSVAYSFNVNLTYYYSMIYNGTQYYCRPIADTDSRFNVIFESTSTNEPFASGSQVSLRFNEFYVGYRPLNLSPVGYSTFSLYLSNNQVGSSYTGSSVSLYFVDSSGLNPLNGLTAVSYSTLNRNLSVSSFNMTYTLSDYDNGFQDGYESGYEDGFSQGSSQAYQDGYSQGLAEGQIVSEQQIQDAYSLGKADGYSEGSNADSTASTIISGIFQVALVPINFFLGIFNFKILGINFSSLIQALFTIAITIIIVKSVFGKNGD